MRINFQKTECMLINCSGSVQCRGNNIAIVNYFKYLGLALDSSAKAPFHMLS